MRVKVNIGRKRNNSGELIKKDCPVLLFVTFNRQRVVLSTGIKINLDDWDAVNRRVLSSHPDWLNLNNRINTFEDSVRRIWKSMESDREIPDARVFREMFKRMRPSFSGFFPLFYAFMEEKNEKWSRSAFLKVRKVYDLLHEFEKSKGKRLSFSCMDAVFLEDFSSFLFAKGYHSSTIRRFVNILVWFLNWATEKGYNLYQEYKLFYNLLEKQKKTDNKNIIFLTSNELELLWSLQVSNRKEQQVRDLFCLSAFTGIRFSEINRLKKNDIGADSLTVTGPRGRVRHITLNEYAGEIVQKYSNKYYPGDKAFPAVSPVSYIKWIRIAGEECGLDRKILLNYKSHERKLFRISSVLSPVIAVNTFIAISLENGMSEVALAGFSGIVRDNRIDAIREKLMLKELDQSSRIPDQNA